MILIYTNQVLYSMEDKDSSWGTHPIETVRVRTTCASGVLVWLATSMLLDFYTELASGKAGSDCTEGVL